jgi:hypothetical protein
VVGWFGGWVVGWLGGWVVGLVKRVANPGFDPGTLRL